MRRPPHPSRSPKMQTRDAETRTFSYVASNASIPSATRFSVRSTSACSLREAAMCAFWGGSGRGGVKHTMRAVRAHTHTRARGRPPGNREECGVFRGVQHARGGGERNVSVPNTHAQSFSFFFFRLVWEFRGCCVFLSFFHPPFCCIFWCFQKDRHFTRAGAIERERGCKWGGGSVKRGCGGETTARSAGRLGGKGGGARLFMFTLTRWSRHAPTPCAPSWRPPCRPRRHHCEQQQHPTRTARRPACRRRRPRGRPRCGAGSR